MERRCQLLLAGILSGVMSALAAGVSSRVTGSRRRMTRIKLARGDSPPVACVTGDVPRGAGRQGVISPASSSARASLVRDM
jgi:hypothetical protein